MKRFPPLSFIFVRSLSFHPSLLILSLSVPTTIQPPPCSLCLQPLLQLLAESLLLRTPISINLFSSRLFGNRSTTIRRRRRRYDTSLFILCFPSSSLIASSSSRISPRSHPLRQLVQTSSQTASKFLKARHRHRGEIGLFVPTPRIP